MSLRSVLLATLCAGGLVYLPITAHAQGFTYVCGLSVFDVNLENNTARLRAGFGANIEGKIARAVKRGPSIFISIDIYRWRIDVDTGWHYFWNQNRWEQYGGTVCQAH